MIYKGTPTEKFWHDWNGRNSKKILKNRGWSVYPIESGWEASISKEEFEKYHTTSVIEDWIDISESASAPEPKLPKPTTFAGSKGAPYDSSDLNKLAPSGCLQLVISGKNGDNFVVDSCLSVVEIIASYLPLKRETSDEKNKRLMENAEQLEGILKKNPDQTEFVLGKNKKNEYRLKVLNRNGLGL